MPKNRPSAMIVLYTRRSLWANFGTLTSEWGNITLPDFGTSPCNAGSFVSTSSTNFRFPSKMVFARRRKRGQRWSAHVDRKSTRLNSSHLVISYAVFCLKKQPRHGAVLGTPRRLNGPAHPQQPQHHRQDHQRRQQAATHTQRQAQSQPRQAALGRKHQRA